MNSVKSTRLKLALNLWVLFFLTAVQSEKTWGNTHQALNEEVSGSPSSKNPQFKFSQFQQLFQDYSNKLKKLDQQLGDKNISSKNKLQITKEMEEIFKELEDLNNAIQLIKDKIEDTDRKPFDEMVSKLESLLNNFKNEKELNDKITNLSRTINDLALKDSSLSSEDKQKLEELKKEIGETRKKLSQIAENESNPNELQNRTAQNNKLLEASLSQHEKVINSLLKKHHGDSKILQESNNLQTEPKDGPHFNSSHSQETSSYGPSFPNVGSQSSIPTYSAQTPLTSATVVPQISSPLASTTVDQPTNNESANQQPKPILDLPKASSPSNSNITKQISVEERTTKTSETNVITQAVRAEPSNTNQGAAREPSGPQSYNPRLKLSTAPQSNNAAIATQAVEPPEEPQPNVSNNKDLSDSKPFASSEYQTPQAFTASDEKPQIQQEPIKNPIGLTNTDVMSTTIGSTPELETLSSTFSEKPLSELAREISNGSSKNQVDVKPEETQIIRAILSEGLTPYKSSSLISLLNPIQAKTHLIKKLPAPKIKPAEPPPFVSRLISYLGL